MAVPRGHGIYGRALPVSYLRQFDWVALETTRADSAGKAARLRAAGVKVWAFTGPERWTPSRWRQTLPEVVAWGARNGCEGIIADPEDGWGRGRPANAREELRALAAALPAGSGVTSFPLLPDFDALERPGLWGSPQLYAKGRGAAAVRFFDRKWRDVWGSRRMVPAVSLWNSNNAETGTPGAYGEYLASIPKSRAYVGWPTSVPPEFRTRAYLAKPVSIAGQLPSFAERWWWWLAGGAAVLGTLAVVWWAR